MVTGLGRAQAPPNRTSIFPDSPCSRDGTQGEKPEIGGIISLQREFFKGFGPEDRFSAWDLYSTSANAWMAVLACRSPHLLVHTQLDVGHAGLVQRLLQIGVLHLFGVAELLHEQDHALGTAVLGQLGHELAPRFWLECSS